MPPSDYRPAPAEQAGYDQDDARVRDLQPGGEAYMTDADVEHALDRVILTVEVEDFLREQ